MMGIISTSSENTKENEIIEYIKTDGLNLKKEEDSDDDEITISIYYTTEEIIYKPKEEAKVLDGIITVNLYIIGKL
jgi:hypothetical protein